MWFEADGHQDLFKVVIENCAVLGIDLAESS
jgi:hypothetical protein